MPPFTSEQTSKTRDRRCLSHTTSMNGTRNVVSGQCPSGSVFGQPLRFLQALTVTAGGLPHFGRLGVT